MTNHATRAASWLNERITVATPTHTRHDIQPDPQGSTEFLEELSADLLREKLRRRPFVKHPARSNVWVRPVSDRDRALFGPSSHVGGPGRDSLGGEAA